MTPVELKARDVEGMYGVGYLCDILRGLYGSHKREEPGHTTVSDAQGGPWISVFISLQEIIPPGLM